MRDVDPIRTILAVPMLKGNDLVPNFTEARVNQFLGFRSQMSHLPTISDTRAPAILGTNLVGTITIYRLEIKPRIQLPSA